MTLFTELGMNDLKAFFPRNKLAQGNQRGRDRRLAFRPRTSRRRGFHKHLVRRVIIGTRRKVKPFNVPLQIGKAHIGGKVSKAKAGLASLCLF
jgi:hypothetical protein